MLPKTRSEAKGPASERSTWEALAKQRGALIKVCFLYPATPDHPVQETIGRLLYARARAIGLSLDQPLPMALNPKTRFSVKVVVDEAMWMFQSQAHEEEPFGGGLLILKPPKQLRAIQRRKFTRAPLNVLVRVSTNGMVLGQARSMDLSAGGMRMTGHLLLLYNQRVSISFLGPDGTAFEGLTGRVVRVEPDARPPTYAVRFDPLLKQTEAAVIALVHKLQILQR